jgi:hypothetical protein
MIPLCQSILGESIFRADRYAMLTEMRWPLSGTDEKQEDGAR